MVIPHRWVARDGCNPRSQPWTPALTLPPMRNGRSVRLMAVFCPFRRPSTRRPVHRQLLRNELLDLSPSVPITTCHQRNYVETYSRYMSRGGLRSLHDDAGCFRFGSFRFNHDFDILIERLEKAQYPINRVAPKATTDHVRYIGLLDPHLLGRCGLRELAGFHDLLHLEH